MRILVGANVPKDPNAGASGTVFRTNEALRALGHEVDEIWEHDLLRKIAHGNLHYLVELPRRYRDAVRERCSVKTYDVIQLSQPHAYLAARDHQRSGRPGIFVIRSHGVEQKVRQALIEHDALPSGGGPFRILASSLMARLLQRHARLAGQFSDGMIVACTDDKAFLVNNLSVNPRKIAVIPEAAPDTFLNLPIQPMTEVRLKKILYVGQFAPFKAPNILANALNSILPRCKQASMSWVCDQKHHIAVRNLLDPSIVDRVHLRSWQTQDELLTIYDEHGIFLYPSYAEGFGKACFEAMVRGLCVVATNTSGMRDYIQNGVSGRLIDVGDSSALTSAVLGLLTQFEYARKLSYQAHIQGAPYSWKRAATCTLEFYKTLKASK